jgi:uncharacterized membrane protein
MKKLTAIGLLVSFLGCILEWPPNNSYFVFQLEYQLFFVKKDVLKSVVHPVILAGIFGHISLLYLAFSKKPKQWIAFTGPVLLGVLVVLFLLSGVLSKNIKMIASTLPFMLISGYYYYLLYQTKNSKSIN